MIDEKYSLAALMRAIRKVEEEKGQALLELFAERSWEEDKVLIALIRKLIPDKQHIELPIGDYLLAIEEVLTRRRQARGGGD